MVKKMDSYFIMSYKLELTMIFKDWGKQRRVGDIGVFPLGAGGLQPRSVGSELSIRIQIWSRSRSVKGIFKISILLQSYENEPCYFPVLIFIGSIRNEHFTALVNKRIIYANDRWRGELKSYQGKWEHLCSALTCIWFGILAQCNVSVNQTKLILWPACGICSASQSLFSNCFPTN